MVGGEERREAEVSVPLLDSSRRRRSGGGERESGGATWAQTLSNVVVSVVGTGVLGLPYAFRVAGWAAGSLGVAVAGVATCYCMLLLIGLCIALAFTFPIMMHPIHDIMEAKLQASGWFQKLSHNVRAAEMFGLHGIRILMVVVVATLASLIPGFGAFISLVGSTVCGLLSFVLPATFHLSLMASRLKTWQRMLDYVILVIGVVFAGYGTYDAVSGHPTST